MDYSKKQYELDVQKWYDSETKCHDTCGEYNYCKSCNKNNTYPCAYAYETYFNSISNSNYQTSKPTYKKTTSTCKSKTSTSKSTAKKSTNKTTTKKTTSKAY